MATLKGQVLRYTLLPGFIPRLHALFTSGFGSVAYFIAIIYQSLRLLPPGHPYLQPQNIGKYGIRHVIAAAADNLVFSRKNIDQIIVFSTILIGVVLLFLQIGLFIAALIYHQPAMAFPTIGEMFGVNPLAGSAQDLAFILFDRIFGLQGVFDSCISDPAQNCQDMAGHDIATSQQYPAPFHKALHALLAFYSYGIFAVGIMVILYFITVITAETATTGSPLGQKYNKTWIPVRIILFLALIVPLEGGGNDGLNAAQRLTFWIAKTGSNFATNSWVRFNQDLNTSYLGDARELIAQPNIPEISELVEFMFVAKTCHMVEELVRGPGFHSDSGIRPYIVRPFSPKHLVDGPNHLNLLTTQSYKAALQHVNYGSMTIRFGSYNNDPGTLQYDEHKKYWSKVRPVCGDVILQVSSMDAQNEQMSAAHQINEIYFNMIRDMWLDQEFQKHADCLIKTTLAQAANPHCLPLPNDDFITGRITTYETALAAQLDALIAKETQNNENWNIPDQLIKKGWAGAAIWYNRIAELNGEVTGAIFNIPGPSRYPMVMEYVAQKKKQNENVPDPGQIFNPVSNGKVNMDFDHPDDRSIALVLQKAYAAWNTSTERHNDGLFVDAIKLIFGVHGIFDMRRNADINPMAQLSSIGKGMMDASLRNLGTGTLSGVLSKLVKNLPVKSVTQVAGDFLTKMGFALIVVSFILYYILPFMPFIYFIFAIGGWIKGIFEAIVAMPLWALAHVTRWDGEGMVGPGAADGYFLLFEIFLRPILILFGMIASISIFSALVITLNDIFAFVVNNIAGFDLEHAQETDGFQDFMRGPIDQLFYTLMYAAVCYMMGLSCFKLIDLIPNQILRWMGSKARAFQETDKDPAGQLLQTVYKGGTLATQKVQGGTLAALIGT